MAADYMRHANERRVHMIERWRFTARTVHIAQSNWRRGSTSTSIWRGWANITAPKVLLKRITGGERSQIWCKPRCASEVNATADLEELQIRLEEQNEVVAEAAEMQGRK